jgi:hypothetical protein
MLIRRYQQAACSNSVQFLISARQGMENSYFLLVRGTKRLSL